MVVKVDPQFLEANVGFQAVFYILPTHAPSEALVCMRQYMNGLCQTNIACPRFRYCTSESTRCGLFSCPPTPSGPFAEAIKRLAKLSENFRDTHRSVGAAWGSRVAEDLCA